MLEKKTMLTIYHNNRCGKSRVAKNLIDTLGKPVEVVDYLQHPPSEKELADILAMLKMKPQELIRTKEAVFQEYFKGKNPFGCRVDSGYGGKPGADRAADCGDGRRGLVSAQRRSAGGVALQTG